MTKSKRKNNRAPALSERECAFLNYASAFQRDIESFLPGIRLRPSAVPRESGKSHVDVAELPHPSPDKCVRFTCSTAATLDDDERLILHATETYYKRTFESTAHLAPPLVEDFYRGASAAALELFIASVGRNTWKRRQPSAGVVRDILTLLDELSNLPYEGQSASVSIALSTVTAGGVRPIVYVGRDMIGSKKTARLFSGSDIVSATLRGELAEVVPLDSIRPGRSPEIFLAADHHQALVRFASRKRALVFSLSENGDVSVIAKGRLVAVRQGAVWRIAGTTAFVKSICDLLAGLSQGEKAHYDVRIAHWLTMAALSMNFRRSGALLVVLPKRIPAELLPRRLQSPLELAYQSLLLAHNVRSASPSLLLNAMTLDGATFLTPRGVILGFGQVVDGRAVSAASEGSRTRAAIAASMYGLAVKISADGPVTVYSNGDAVRELLPRPHSFSPQTERFL